MNYHDCFLILTIIAFNPNCIKWEGNIIELPSFRLKFGEMNAVEHIDIDNPAPKFYGETGFFNYHHPIRTDSMNDESKYRVTLFHCINIFGDGEALPLSFSGGAELKFVKLPCSSMVKDVFLLRAFESGADAVVVLVCPEGACRYVEGNFRAGKRVQFVAKLLDEIGLDGRRLALFNIKSGDVAAVDKALAQTLSRLAELGPNPAA
jgi:coenzyme F420-reducing hydrogenase delta subunit